MGGLMLTSPSPVAPTGKVATLSLLHLHFAFGVKGYGDLPPIWEAVVRGEGGTEGLVTLNQALMRGLPSCFQIFWGGVHFSASLTLLDFVKNVSLWNPSLDPECDGGEFTPWLTRQREVEAATRGRSDASLLSK